MRFIIHTVVILVLGQIIGFGFWYIGPLGVPEDIFLPIYSGLFFGFTGLWVKSLTFDRYYLKRGQR